MIGILIGSGENVPINRLKLEIKKADFLVAVDGGMNHLDRLNIIPNLIIGDEDSISEDVLKSEEIKHIKKVKFPREKDSTDMELAINYLNQLGCTELIIFGGIGSRLDHSLGNIFLLNRLYDLGIKGRIIARNNEIILVADNYTIKSRNYDYVSIIPIDNRGACVSLMGFKYPLDKYLIKYGSTIGISNEILGYEAEIKVHSGRVLVFISKD